MMQLNEFLPELQQLVARRGSAHNLVDTLAFVEEVAERLESDPVFGEFEPAEYQGAGTNGRTLKLHGYTRLDETDGSIGVVIGRWDNLDQPQTLTTADVTHLSAALENFLKEAVAGTLHERIAEVNPGYELALTLAQQRGRINRIRLHLFTNLTLSSRFKEERHGELAGIPLERHIWDLPRLSALYQSSREREAVEINLEELGGMSIPCLEASRTDSLSSYLCVVPADLLANLFERYGSRLLEGNVRSFLGLKVGVNKGIRATIQDSPSLFFAYNNGIAATASEVILEERNGQTCITRLVDLQIVNGGQTTASILSARKKDRLNLSGISVPMKLTKVQHDHAQELIPKIAEYANTQNKVAIADFFANHPVHRKLEEISRRLLTPAKPGQRIQSKWFYERSRGQYQNERLYLSKSESNSFQQQYPPDQLINKTDLSKYSNTWTEFPHWVSLGAQKNFSKFSTLFESKNPAMSDGDYWEKISPQYGDAYFSDMVAVAIFWHKMESIVDSAKTSWYEGGYRANIVTYTLSKMAHDARRAGREIDLATIWMEQAVPVALSQYLDTSAQEIQQILINPPPGEKNIGEWCKKLACWELVAELELSMDAPIESTVSTAEHQSRRAEGKKIGAIDDGISVQQIAYTLCENGYWSALNTWDDAPILFTAGERALVQKASQSYSFLKIALEKDWKKLLALKKRAEDEGFRRL